MPVVLLQYQTKLLGRIAAKLAQALPAIVAPELAINNRDRGDGGLVAEDIIVRCVEGGLGDVNSKEIEIIIFAHDFPERKTNLEERKNTIIAGVREFFVKEDFRGVTGFVWVMLMPTAFGEL